MHKATHNAVSRSFHPIAEREIGHCRVTRLERSFAFVVYVLCCQEPGPFWSRKILSQFDSSSSIHTIM